MSTTDDLFGVIYDLTEHEQVVMNLRAQRREIIAALRADGMSLQAIADLVGRSKQTVAQWS